MTRILYAPVLGQSNAKMMALLAKDRDSGIGHLQRGLEAQAGFDKVFTLQPHSDGNWKTLAVGSSTIDGNIHPSGGRIWWYSDDNQPGVCLTDALAVMREQLADLRAQGSVTPVIIWGQGETEASWVGSASTDEILQQRADRYANATREMFDFLKLQLAPELKFFIMETGRYSTEGALDAGQSQETIDRINRGLKAIDAAQAKLAADYADIHMGVDYDDLKMRAEEPVTNPDWNSTWNTDVWHYSQQAYETIGDRLAASISSALQAPAPAPGEPATVAVGTEGDDIVIAGRMDVTMFGLGGADKFRFTKTSLGGTHIVKDFDRAEGDMIDVKSVLIEFDRLQDSIADFVQSTRVGSDIRVSVDRDGQTGGLSYSELMIIRNLDAFDPAEMLAAKVLLA
jgi:hypothetical protein